ncbi:hypothetical protein BDBG_17715 [Blastomyces gilchristii SLH14081]|uniref:Uncharacterized protein n=1 Tax=Blastomyces gilchristii (strain SLH14081) TaxID=559298 RepID=A0A179V2P4_BLAGS|nr:uncharacterized protein BDBG_17715 [Blastomyces gilchristii SLH14081]OAT12882.1 hypothetical protein BDBG_17715 [Blastomyces gilchristii SLH14081]
MSKSTTTFNGREHPIVRSAHHGTTSAATTITISSVSRIASILSRSASVLPTAHNFSSRGNPVTSILLSSHRLNAGIAVTPSQI